jgi:hypothetical protein
MSSFDDNFFKPSFPATQFDIQLFKLVISADATFFVVFPRMKNLRALL